MTDNVIDKAFSIPKDETNDSQYTERMAVVLLKDNMAYHTLNSKSDVDSFLNSNNNIPKPHIKIVTIETAEKYMWASESIRTWVSAIKSKHE
jgi:ATP-dependent protease HslVU (ClpYQ) peptidase subunit